MKHLFLYLFFVISLTSNAQNSNNQNFNFSLQQAIDYGLKNNNLVKNATLDIELSKQKKRETTAMGLPQINADLGYLNNFEFQVQGVSGNAFNPLGDPDAISTLAFGTKHTVNGKITLSQLIFDGSYLVALQASKTYLEFFENAKKKTDNEVKESIINSYGSVLLATESIKILENNKKNLEKNYNDVNQIFKNGLTEEESVEQISITLSTVKSSLENVKRLKEISLKLLKINLGLSITDGLVLTDNLEDLSKNNLSMAQSDNFFNIEKSTDYQIVLNITIQKKLLLKLEKSKALPSLGAAVNFGYNSFANRFNFLNNNQKWNNYSNLGVSLSVPIFSSFARTAKAQQAKIAYQESQNNQNDVAQKLKLQFEKSKSDFDFSIEQYATAKLNLKLAERIENKEQIKFREGLSTSFELAEAQRQLYAAQQNYLQSMVDIINKKASFEKVQR